MKKNPIFNRRRTRRREQNQGRAEEDRRSGEKGEIDPGRGGREARETGQAGGRGAESRSPGHRRRCRGSPEARGGEGEFKDS